MGDFCFGGLENRIGHGDLAWVDTAFANETVVTGTGGFNAEAFHVLDVRVGRITHEYSGLTSRHTYLEHRCFNGSNIAAGNGQWSEQILKSDLQAGNSGVGSRQIVSDPQRGCGFDVE